MRRFCIVLSVILFTIIISISSSGLAEEVQGISIFQGDNGKYGVLETDTNEVLIAAQYDSIGPWEFDLAYVGFSSDADKYGNVLYAQTELNNRFGVIDNNGLILAEAEWEGIESIDHGYIIVKRNGLHGIVKNNVVLSEPIWSQIVYNPYDDNFNVSIWYDNEMDWYGAGKLNSNGDICIPPVFEELTRMREGFAFYKKNELWGIVNDSGEIITEPVYGGFGFYDPEFNDGLACVWRGNLCGYIDYTGRYVILPYYSYGSDFHQGYAYVQDPNTHKYGIIDKSDTYIVPPSYDADDIDKIYYELTGWIP